MAEKGANLEDWHLHLELSSGIPPHRNGVQRPKIYLLQECGGRNIL